MAAAGWGPWRVMKQHVRGQCKHTKGLDMCARICLCGVLFLAYGGGGGGGARFGHQGIVSPAEEGHASIR